jgi:hypothetical protein
MRVEKLVSPGKMVYEYVYGAGSVVDKAALGVTRPFPTSVVVT